MGSSGVLEDHNPAQRSEELTDKRLLTK